MSGQSDQISVSGNISNEAGTLTPSLLTGYTPTNADAIAFLTQASTAPVMAAFTTVVPLIGFSTGYNLAIGEAARLIYASVPGTATFTNAIGGLDWSVAGNWSTGALPGSLDTALISAGHAVTHSTGTDSIGALTINSSNSLDVSGGSLAVSGVTTLDGTLAVSGTGSVALNGVLEGGFGGQVILSGGSLALGANASMSGLNMTGGTLTGAGSLSVLSSFGQTGGSINQTGAVNISQNSGNLSVGAISAASIQLSALNGGISQTTALVTAGELTTRSATGTVLTHADNQIARFAATNTTSGVIELSNSGALTLSNIANPNGAVTVINTGSVTLTDSVNAGGSLSLTATGGDLTQDAGIISNANANANASAEGNALDMTLSGANITLRGVQSNGNITLNSAGDVNLLGLGSGNYVDDTYFTYNLPFTFNYFGTDYTQAFITTNGLITFDSGTSSYSDSVIGLASYKAIAPAWNDWVLQGNAGKDIRIAASTGNLSVVWDVVRYGYPVNSEAPAAKFESILRPNGEIQFNYGAAVNGSFVDDVTIGLSNGLDINLVSGLMSEPSFSLNFLKSTTFTPLVTTGVHSYVETVSEASLPLSAFGTISGSAILGQGTGMVVSTPLTLSIHAVGMINAPSQLAAGTLQFVSSGGASFTAVNNLFGVIGVSSNLASSANADAVGDVTIYSSGAQLTLNGLVNDQGGTTVNNAGGIAVAGSINTSGNLVLAAQGGDVNLSASLLAGGNMAVSAGQDILLNHARWLAGGSVDATAYRDIRLLSNFAAAASIEAANNIQLTTQAGALYVDSLAANAASESLERLAYIRSTGGDIGVVTSTGFYNGSVSGFANAAALASPNGRWLMWTSSPDAMLTAASGGSLLPDFIQYNAIQGVTLPATTGNGLMYALTPEVLTATLTGSVSKVYDGLTGIDLSGVGLTNVSGALFGDVVTGAELAGLSGSLSDKNVGSAKLVTVANPTLTGVVSSAATGSVPVYGYSVNASGNIGQITPASLAVSGINAVSKTYDGSTLATLLGAPVMTPLGSDDVSLVGNVVGAFADKNVGQGKTVTISGLTLGGADAGNYNLLEQVGLSATITQLSSVTWTGTSGNWSDAANWAGGAVPDLANVATVVIPAGSNVNFDASAGDVDLSSLSSQGTLTMAGRQLTVTGSLQTSALRLNAGTLNGTGDLTSADFSQTGGNLAGTFANLNLGSAGNLNLSSSLTAMQSIVLKSNAAILASGPQVVLTAPSVVLGADSGVGSPATPLQLNTQALLATTKTGGIDLVNSPTGAVSLTGLSTGNAANLSYSQNGQALKIMGNITSGGGDILIDPPTDLSMNPDTTVSTEGGSIDLQASGNVVLAAVKAPTGSVSISTTGGKISSATPGANNVTADKLTLASTGSVELAYLANTVDTTSVDGPVTLSTTASTSLITDAEVVSVISAIQSSSDLTSTSDASTNTIITITTNNSITEAESAPTTDIDQTNTADTSTDDKTEEAAAEQTVAPDPQTIVVANVTIEKPAEEIVRIDKPKGRQLVCR